MIDRLGKYNLLEIIGAGVLGEVYRARDTQFGRTVAIKLVPDEIMRDEARRAQLVEDARAASALSHPSIATLFEIGEEDESLFLVFEYVRGRSLREELGGKPMPTRSAIDLAIQLADALAAAHAVGVLNRGLRPETVVITAKGRAKILDFGFADWTRGGAMDEAADEHGDIRALGAIVFEMLTGHPPSTGDTFPRPSRVNPALPEELDPILARALATDPAESYQTAATLAAELRAVAAILDVRIGDAEAAGFLPPARRSGGGRRWLAASTLVAVLAAAAWLWGGRLTAMWSRYTAPPPEPVLVVVPAGPADQAGHPSGGFAADLAIRLGRMPGVQVLARSGLSGARPDGVNAAARALGARAVVSVSARQTGGRLEVEATLGDATRGIERWRGTFERPAREAFAVETEVAEAVAAALGITLAPSATRARTLSRIVDPGAYDVYLRGREAAERGDVARAAAFFREAVRLDPALAEAQAGLALALCARAGEGLRLDRDDLLTEARAAAAEAAGVDPDLPEAHVALGLASDGLRPALDALKRALEIDPTFAGADAATGDAVVGIAPARASAFYDRALEIDPGFPGARASLVDADLRRDRLAEAEADLVTAHGAGVALPIAEATLRLLQKRPDDALKAAARAGDPAEGAVSAVAAAASVTALQALGRTRDAFDLARAKAAQDPQSCDVAALTAALARDLGEPREAADILAPIDAAAERPDAPPAALACVAQAAAARGDAGRTAGALQRIAADEAAVRAFVLSDRSFRRDWYPWTKVSADPRVQAAARSIAAARERLRAIAVDALAGVQ